MVWKLSAPSVHIGALPLVLGKRGDRSLLLPSLSQPRQPAGAVGSCHEAAAASSYDRSLPSAWPRYSLDWPLVTTSSVIVPRENTGQRHHARRNRGEATGTRRTRQVADIPSIISIHAASIIVIALNAQRDCSRWARLSDVHEVLRKPHSSGIREASPSLPRS